MKTSVESFHKVDRSCQVSGGPNSNKCEVFSLESANLTEPLIEIKIILNEVYLKVNKFCSELQQKCFSLEAAFQNLKKTKQCSQCSKVETEDAIFNKTILDEKFLSNPRTSPTNKLEDISSCIQSLSPMKTQVENENQNELLKTPPSKKSNFRTSPVVQKQTRSGKRKMVRLSSKSRAINDKIKKSPAINTEFCELISTNRTLEEKPESEIRDGITPLVEESDDSFLIAPSPVPESKNQRRVNSIFGDKKLSDVNAYMNNDDDVSPPASMNISANCDVSPSNDNSSPLPVNILANCKVSPPNDVSSPLSVNILANCKISPPKTENKSNINDNMKKQKMKWDLKKSRDINGNTKFKQTTLSTSFFTKPVDITESNNFKGGVPSDAIVSKLAELEDMELTNINNPSTYQSTIKEDNLSNTDSKFEETVFYNDQPLKDKENQPSKINKPSTPPREAIFHTDRLKKSKVVIQEINEKENKPIIESSAAAQDETFFNPLVTSTHQEVEIKKEPSPKIIAPVIKNSFDYIPSPEKEPKYKYRRDAVRKKSERQKLDGWECAMCLNFYLQHRKQFGDTQINLIRKCSRHRDKFPIHANTPPGLWYPKFDDTDDESD